MDPSPGTLNQVGTLQIKTPIARKLNQALQRESVPRKTLNMVQCDGMQFFLERINTGIDNSVNLTIWHTCSNYSANTVCSSWEQCCSIGIKTLPLAFALTFRQVSLLEPSISHLFSLLTEILCLQSPPVFKHPGFLYCFWVPATP